MVSFDDEALYTNVPTDDALGIIKELLENDDPYRLNASVTKEHTKLSRISIHAHFSSSMAHATNRKKELQWKDPLDQ